MFYVIDAILVRTFQRFVKSSLLLEDLSRLINGGILTKSMGYKHNRTYHSVKVTSCVEIIIFHERVTKWLWVTAA